MNQQGRKLLQQQGPWGRETPVLLAHFVLSNISHTITAVEGLSLVFITSTLQTK